MRALCLGILSSTGLLLLLAVLGHALHVVCLHLLARLHVLSDLGLAVALLLQQLRSDEGLDLGRLLLLALLEEQPAGHVAARGVC